MTNDVKYALREALDALLHAHDACDGPDGVATCDCQTAKAWRRVRAVLLKGQP